MDNQFKQRIDQELGDINFSTAKKEEILSKADKKKYSFRQWLNKEIEIDMMPAVAVLCLCIWGYGFSLMEFVPNAGEIQASQLEIIQVDRGEEIGTNKNEG